MLSHNLYLSLQSPQDQVRLNEQNYVIEMKYSLLKKLLKIDHKNNNSNALDEMTKCLNSYGFDNKTLLSINETRNKLLLSNTNKDEWCKNKIIINYALKYHSNIKPDYRKFHIITPSTNSQSQTTNDNESQITNISQNITSDTEELKTLTQANLKNITHITQQNKINSKILANNLFQIGNLTEMMSILTQNFIQYNYAQNPNLSFTKQLSVNTIKKMQSNQCIRRKPLKNAINHAKDNYKPLSIPKPLTKPLNPLTNLQTLPPPTNIMHDSQKLGSDDSYSEEDKENENDKNFVVQNKQPNDSDSSFHPSSEIYDSHKSSEGYSSESSSSHGNDDTPITELIKDKTKLKKTKHSKKKKNKIKSNINYSDDHLISLNNSNKAFNKARSTVNDTNGMDIIKMHNQKYLISKLPYPSDNEKDTEIYLTPQDHNLKHLYTHEQENKLLSSNSTTSIKDFITFYTNDKSKEKNLLHFDKSELIPIAYVPEAPHKIERDQSIKHGHFELNLSLSSIVLLLKHHFSNYPQQQKYNHITKLFTKGHISTLSYVSVIADDLYDFIKILEGDKIKHLYIGHGSSRIILTNTQYIDWICRETQIPKKTIRTHNKKNYITSNESIQSLIKNFEQKLKLNLVSLYAFVSYIAYRLNINISVIILFNRSKKWYNKMDNNHKKSKYYNTKPRIVKHIFSNNQNHEPPLQVIINHSYISQYYPKQRIPTTSMNDNNIIFDSTPTVLSVFYYNPKRKMEDIVKY